MIIEHNRNISVIKKKIKVTCLKLSLNIHGGLQSLASLIHHRQFYLNSPLLSIDRTENNGGSEEERKQNKLLRIMSLKIV